MADRVRPAQELFAVTGGVHAACAFRPRRRAAWWCGRTSGATTPSTRWWVELHLDHALPAGGLGLYVSGRAGFEIVQKAWAAGFGTVVAVGAPTSLAVEVARTAGITLAAFLRPGGINVYSPG